MKLKTIFYKYIKYVPVINRFFNWKSLVFSCEKKITYLKEESAKKAAEEMNMKPTTRNQLESYKCRFCDLWHIGRIDHYAKRKREGRLKSAPVVQR